MRGLALTVAIGAALAFAACGGDDNDNASSNTTQTTATQGTGSPGKQAGKKNGKGGSATSGGSDGKTTQTETQTESGTQTKTTPAAPTTPKGPYAIAKAVCQNTTPIIIQRQLKRGKTTKKKVAKQYSTGWPAGQRKKAYDGCLAGLNKKFK